MHTTEVNLKKDLTTLMDILSKMVGNTIWNFSAVMNGSYNYQSSLLGINVRTQIQFHPGCCVSNEKIPDWEVKTARWEAKKQFLEERGNLISIRGLTDDNR